MNKDYVTSKIKEINSFNENINIMEVCGTHTMCISKYGLRELIHSNINLISGPGCPVCVTDQRYIDYIYKLALKEDIVICTYGDMIRVPGSKSFNTLENAKAKGADVRVVYSSIDALSIAQKNPSKKIVFLAIGFETTTPSSAIAVLEAYKNNIDNFYLLSMHKTIEPVMRKILEEREVNIQGFICPGHVAAIIGEEGFGFLREYTCPGVITGFTLEEIVSGIYLLIKNIKEKNYSVENTYKVLVKKQGNMNGIKLIRKVFCLKDEYWRGMGLIEKSGLKLKKEYEKYDIERVYPLEYKECTNNSCMCGEIIKGKIKPNSCALFGKYCTPENPMGPCMVSSEGSCAAYFKYGIGR